MTQAEVSTAPMALKLRQIWKENGGIHRFVRILEITEHPHGGKSVMMETVRRQGNRWVNTSYSASWINANRFNGAADGFSLHEDVK